MRKNWKKFVAAIVSITLVISVPIASRVITKVKAADYSLVWSDEFDGNSLNRNNWTVETGTGDWGWGNNEQQYYRDSTENIEVSNGTLKIHALRRDNPIGGKYYTSGRMKTAGKQSFLYGKIEARMKLPRFQGSWPAFWMLGDSINRGTGWPACGEMDIMEAINNNNNIYSNLHWQYNGKQADTSGKAYNVGDRTAWHTYGMEWTKDKASFYVDDQVFETYSITTSAQMEEFRAKQFIILNLAIGGQWPGYEIDDTAFPSRSTMEVDYVRVYQKPEEVTTKYDGPTIVITEDALDRYVGGWNSFFGKDIGWIPATGNFQPKERYADGYAIDITNVGEVQNDSAWAVQGNLERIPYRTGATYTYKCTLLSSVDKKVFVKVADGNEGQLGGAIVQLRANTPYYYETTVEIPEDFDSSVSLKFGWGKMEGDTIEDGGQLSVRVKDVSFITTTTIPDPAYTTTPAPSTSKTPATTKAVTPTKKSSSKKAATVKLGKTKIKKVKRAKKSLKFKLKKIKGATGYHIRYSDNKKFDGYWDKRVKKISVKIKKLDRKTKYYIKARAFRKVGNVYYYGKFSKRKKAKTK
ncbi:MAG: glycoside hydrolase family 16 protein [Eubacterium sp.]|nr:glycoside hydrolase family 16 protein [Eubacterium sp.]